MAATKHDPHSLGDLARVVALGVKIQRRQARGQTTTQLEKQVDAIRAKAEAREQARAKK